MQFRYNNKIDLKNRFKKAKYQKYNFKSILQKHDISRVKKKIY